MQGIYSERYYNLSQFLSSYFNQDWRADYFTPEMAIQGFIVENGEKSIIKTFFQLNQLLEENLSAEVLDNILLNDFDVYYDYRVDKISSINWLKWVREKMIHYAKQDKNLDLEKDAG